MTYAERCERIAELERANRDANYRFERQRAIYAAHEAMMRQAVDLYVATITAPWRALAAELRR